MAVQDIIFLWEHIDKSGIFDEGVVRVSDFMQFIDGVLRETKNSIRKYRMSGIIDKPV